MKSIVTPSLPPKEKILPNDNGRRVRLPIERSQAPGERKMKECGDFICVRAEF